MTAHQTVTLADAAAEPIHDAHSHVAYRALTPSTIGDVGLELEFHLVDVNQAARRVGWPQLTELLNAVPPLPGGSRVSVEPGGQLELSTPPYPGVVAAIDALRRDQRVVSEVVGQAGLGLACIGSDLARPVYRISPVSRYVAMERHLDAMGYGRWGRAMMASTAALQVNVNAGAVAGWARRLERIHRLGPVLVALSACSPMIGGHLSGWQSMRQQAWAGMDPARCGPLPSSTDPAQAWAGYALSAPVMLLRNPGNGEAAPVTERVSFARWIADPARFGRAPTSADLDYHLTTLFPPVRPRGYLEIRYLDAVPNPWWPALAALTVTLLDDDIAADQVASLGLPFADAWTRAARNGLHDSAIFAAAQSCAEIAARRCPAELRPDVEAYTDLVASRRTPGDLIRGRIAQTGPLAVLEEQAHA
jgi:glutamate--cysteine ligase